MFVTILVSLLGVALLAGATIYFWPLSDSKLQKSPIETMTYSQSIDRIRSLNGQETAAGVKPECLSRLHAHGEKTTKAVVMFHGVTSCPKQFNALAQKFYDEGYNVYIPRVPHHGLPDGREHGKVTAEDLANYVTNSMNIASGLGDERGVVGLSGGGVLATWAAEYREDVKHLLLLSPFYEPSVSQAPKWQLPFLYVLYGKHILPDRFVEPKTPGDAAFSYSALANYSIVAKNLRKDNQAPGLLTIGLVTSAIDDQIDLDLAKKIPTDIATANSLTLLYKTLPSDWGIVHDIVDDPEVIPHWEYLFNLYFDYYEGR